MLVMWLNVLYQSCKELNDFRNCTGVENLVSYIKQALLLKPQASSNEEIESQ